jgi:hypothetical protein
MERYFENMKEVLIKNNPIYKNLPQNSQMCHSIGIYKNVFTTHFFRFVNTRIFLFYSSSLGTYYEEMERYFETMKDYFIKNNIIYKNLPQFSYRCHGLGYIECVFIPIF